MIVRLLPCLLLLAASSQPLSAADNACFTDEAIDPVAGALLAISGRTDELVGVEMQDGAGPQSVYLLTRQLALVERILRRLLGRGDDCAAIAEFLARDYANLKRIYNAFGRGDQELAIEIVASRRSQALLQEIQALLNEIEPTLTGLVQARR